MQVIEHVPAEFLKISHQELEGLLFIVHHEGRREDVPQSLDSPGSDSRLHLSLVTWPWASPYLLEGVSSSIRW